ncbi:hypothetical protein CAPTEDRAFT_226041 [Capitella teleta]|uniref:Uncharacterized protein n=1 Tax=Capitella teleta TaxID=283909 RepID=R7TMH8_CAPTE|nr:hypothetical protein CAPTEDRAFT_226041 [Capitella teleta]|eukprot:ELT94737.1 hypothetical protein CAPTEDRAFT_226041 [Capitella teleta]
MEACYIIHHEFSETIPWHFWSFVKSDNARFEGFPLRAEENMVAADKAFDFCSEVARKELVHYRRQKTFAFQEVLTRYAEAKVKTATDTYALLSKALTNIKQLDLNV